MTVGAAVAEECAGCHGPAETAVEGIPVCEACSAARVEVLPGFGAAIDQDRLRAECDPERERRTEERYGLFATGRGAVPPRLSLHVERGWSRTPRPACPPGRRRRGQSSGRRARDGVRLYLTRRAYAELGRPAVARVALRAPRGAEPAGTAVLELTLPPRGARVAGPGLVRLGTQGNGFGGKVPALLGPLREAGVRLPVRRLEVDVRNRRGHSRPRLLAFLPVEP